MSDPRLPSSGSSEVHDANVPVTRLAVRCWRVVRGRGSLIVFVAAFCFWLGKFAGAGQKTESLVRADTIKAQKYELVGANGVLLASLHKSASGAPVLTLFDANGSRRLEVGIFDGVKPGVKIYDAKENQRVSLISDDKDGPKLMMGVTVGTGPGIVLHVDGAQPQLSIGRGKQGRLSLSLNDDGAPSIHFMGKDLNGGITISADSNGPFIDLVGKDSLSRMTLRLKPDGSPQFSMADQHGTPRMSISVDKDGNPSIRQFERKARL